jgi:hypothetical protein
MMSTIVQWFASVTQVRQAVLDLLTAKTRRKPPPFKASG